MRLPRLAPLAAALTLAACQPADTVAPKGAEPARDPL